MNTVDFIMDKRNGLRHSNEDIQAFVSGTIHDQIPDYQIAAWLMAVFFNGLDPEERSTLTAQMARQGDQIDLSSIKGKVVDKHSTGGVGDKTTLAIGPIVASCGVPVAKLSGRGLGITGGTIDKLEAIPGFQTEYKIPKMIDQVNRIGIALSSSTPNLVPADKKLYALRDVTATTDEPSLIASSIMSKKLAGGASAFVLDVKVGSGAFMKSVEEAKSLAQIMVEIAKSHNRQAVAILSDMNQPLGNTVGNALEVCEAQDVLLGKGPKDITELVMVLSSYMIALSRNASLEEAQAQAKESIRTGKAFQKWRQWVNEQGGDITYLDHPSQFFDGIHKVPFLAKEDGVLQMIHCDQIGHAAMILGAGRESKSDAIDFGVGLDLKKKIGDPVSNGEEVLTIYYRDSNRLERALGILRNAIVIGEGSVENHSLVWDIIH